MFTKSVPVSVPVSKMGVVLIKPGGRESQWTVLLRYLINILLCQQMLDATKRIVDDSIVFQQDIALVHLAFNTVQLLQCKTVNFLSPE